MDPIKADVASEEPEEADVAPEEPDKPLESLDDKTAEEKLAYMLQNFNGFAKQRGGASKLLKEIEELRATVKELAALEDEAEKAIRQIEKSPEKPQRTAQAQESEQTLKIEPELLFEDLSYDQSADERAIAAYDHRRAMLKEKYKTTKELSEEEKHELRFMAVQKKKLQSMMKSQLAEKAVVADDLGKNKHLKNEYLDAIIAQSDILSDIRKNFTDYAEHPEKLETEYDVYMKQLVRQKEEYHIPIPKEMANWNNMTKTEKLLAGVESHLKMQGDKLESLVQKSNPDIKKVPYSAEDILLSAYAKYIETTSLENGAEKALNKHWRKSIPSDIVMKAEQQFRERTVAIKLNGQEMANNMKPSEIRALEKSLRDKNYTYINEVEGPAGQNNILTCTKALQIIHQDTALYMQDQRGKIYRTLSAKDSLSTASKNLKQLNIAKILLCNMVSTPPESVSSQMKKDKYAVTGDVIDMTKLQEKLSEQFMENGISRQQINSTFGKWAKNIMASKDFQKTFENEKVLDKVLKELIKKKDDPKAFLKERELLEKVFNPESLLVDNSKVAEKSNAFVK